MNIYELNLDNNFVLLYGRRDNSIYSVLNNYCSKFSDKQILIIDMNRRWQPDINNKRIRYIRPISKFNVLKTVFELSDLLNPRLALLIIDGLPQFLKDYQGKTAKENLYNEKIYAAILSNLKYLSNEYSIKVVLTSFEVGIGKNNPVFHDINKYYKITEIKIDK